MKCSNCGADGVDQFCGVCGARQETLEQPIQFFADTIPQAPKKGLAKPIKILVTVLLAVFALGSIGLGVTSNSAITKHQNLMADAITKAQDYNDSAAAYDTMYQESVSGRDRCYVNWYCSSTTYREWLDLVSKTEALAAEARSNAATWDVILGAEMKARDSATTMRTVGFVFAGLFIVGLVLFLVLTRSRAQKPQL